MFFRFSAKRIRHGRSRRYSVFAALVLASSFVHAQSGGLALSDALRMAMQASASGRAADATIQSSREAAAKAGQLPDPMLKVGIDNLPVNGADRWSVGSDFMTMRRVGIEQQWVSADKRAARTQRAKRAVEMDEAAYLSNMATVREEAAKAWIAAWSAQRMLVLTQAIEKEMANDLQASHAAHRSAKVDAADTLQSRVALSQAQDATHKAEQELASARIALSRWIAAPVVTVADAVPPLVSHVPGLPVEELEKYQPNLLMARRAITLADADIDVAVRERRPDWSVEVGYSQRGSQYSNMVSIGVSIPLPVNPSQRQDRDVAEKSALATRARMQYEDALRELQADIQGMSSRLASMNERLTRLKEQLLPAAMQRVELATAAYRSGTSTLNAVFAARKDLLEKRLQIGDLEKEAALTWAGLEYHVVPHELVDGARTEQ